MTKAELIESVQKSAQEETGKEISKKVVKACIDGMLNDVSNCMAGGGEILLQPVGRFTTKFRKARKATNMHTKEPIDIPAKYVPSFAPTTALKDAVAELPVA